MINILNNQDKNMSDKIKDGKIASKTLEIEKLNSELDFLNDTKDFYEFDLGTDSKPVAIINFNKESGLEFIHTDNASKLEEPWYFNYSGFLTEEATEASKIYQRVRSQLKMYRIHKQLYPLGLLSNSSVRYTIGYNSTTGEFVPKQVSVDLGASESPSVESGDGLIDNTYYFESSLDAQQAIDWMKGANQDDTVLRSYLGVEEE